LALSFAKTEAILGAPSALEAILSQQKVIAAPIRPTIQPASYSLPRYTPAARFNATLGSDAAASGKPDVFGSVALRVRHTTLDSRWGRVRAAQLTVAAAGAAGVGLGMSDLAKLEAVNRYVNRRVTFVDDRKQYGRADVWSAAADTLSRRRGDCEDYAIAKLQLLRRAGFDDRDLYLVIVKDLVTRADHAVLVVRTGGRMLVLDNGTERVMDSDEIHDYRPILTFSAEGAWTHGYRVHTPTIDVASNDAETARALAPSSDNQRSRSASLLALSTGFNK
jgi:predicted transglutaminase-like cysteine proteinase